MRSSLVANLAQALPVAPDSAINQRYSARNNSEQPNTTNHHLNSIAKYMLNPACHTKPSLGVFYVTLDCSAHSHSQQRQQLTGRRSSKSCFIRVDAKQRARPGAAYFRQQYIHMAKHIKLVATSTMT